MKTFSIGKLAEQTGCKIPTIRYYEGEGLLPQPFRTEGNQRRYNAAHLKRLNFIIHSRKLGFSLDEVRELIYLSNIEGAGHDADLIAEKHLQSVEQKIKQLRSLSKQLKVMLDTCSNSDKQEPCFVIDSLFDHSLCQEDH